MAHEIRVPRLGWSMEEGTFIRWLKRDGAAVRAGEPLFELEGEKALQEIEAVDSGILRIDPAGPADGAVVPVGALLGYLVAEGEQLPSSDQMAEPAPGFAAGRPATPAEGANDAGQGRGAAPQTAASDSGLAAAASSPRARRVAAELAIDWKTLAGSGRGGRIREQDVRSAAVAARPGRQEAGGQHTVPGSGRGTPLTSRRRVIAERMAASCRQAAPVTLTTRTSAARLASRRAEFKGRGGRVPSYTDMVAKLAARALSEHPHLAACWHGDELILPSEDGFDIGVAVDTPEGLLVPVIRDVGRRSLLEIAQDSTRLVEAARSGRLAAADMQGGVFTITNLGGMGIDAFTPIINLPQVAILGLGAIRREAIVAEDGQIVPHEMLSLSLTFDHRAVDGAPAARFLQSLAAAIADADDSLLGSA